MACGGAARPDEFCTARGLELSTEAVERIRHLGQDADGFSG